MTVVELTDGGQGERIMSRKNYDALVMRKRLNILRPGKGLDSYALIEWTSIPERFKEKYIAKYGDPEQKIMEKEQELKYDTEAEAYFADKAKDEIGFELKSEKIKEYSMNASVLNRLIERIQIQKLNRNKCGNSTPIAWDGIVAESERLRAQSGHTLPKSAARLQDKIRQYRKEGYRCLISGKLCNMNTVKITDEAGERLIALKSSLTPRYTNHQIWEQFNKEAVEKGWKQLKSPSSVTQFLERTDVKWRWYDAVYGEHAAKQKYSRQNVTVMPTRRDSLWYGDGTKLNLYYKAYTPSGYKLATLWVFEVIDAYSECLLGYDISTTEDFESMFRAYRRAIETAGHLPVELAFDGQGGTRRGDAQEWMGRIAKYSHWVAPHNPQSKTIESIFGRFQSQVLYRHFNYTGGNITDKSEKSRPNLEFIQANIDKLPTYEELCSMYAEARQEWNSMRHPKQDKPRIELYESSVNEESTAVTDVMMRNLFWITSQKPVQFTARGLQITINRKQYIYDVYGEDGYPDMKFRRDYTGRSFYVQYDPEDMDTVRLCTLDENYGYQFVTEARPYMTFHRAMQDQKEGERSLIFKLIDQAKLERVRRYIDNKELRMRQGVAPEQHGFAAPKLQGMTAAEFEYYADIVMKEKAARRLEQEPEPVETVPVTLGQQEKELSNMTFDREYDFANRM